ncbi:hypothetical protein GCM10027047_13610 [Rhodococcus aerolatus]
MLPSLDAVRGRVLLAPVRVQVALQAGVGAVVLVAATALGLALLPDPRPSPAALGVAAVVAALVGVAVAPLAAPRLRRLRHCLLPVADRDPAEVAAIARAARRGPVPADREARTVALHRAEELLDQMGAQRGGAALQVVGMSLSLTAVLVNGHDRWWVWPLAAVGVLALVSSVRSRRRQVGRVAELRTAVAGAAAP